MVGYKGHICELMRWAKYYEIDDIPLYSKAKLRNLEKLRVHDYDGWSNFMPHSVLIKDIPDSIGGLENLRYLSIDTTFLKTLPDSICRLSKLTLEISSQIEELPDSIGELKNLRSLYIKSIMLKSLPDSIRELKKLESLNIAAGKMNFLPESIDGLENLIRLFIDSSIPIESFPKRTLERVKQGKILIYSEKKQYW